MSDLYVRTITDRGPLQDTVTITPYEDFLMSSPVGDHLSGLMMKNVDSTYVTPESWNNIQRIEFHDLQICVELGDDLYAVRSGNYE